MSFKSKKFNQFSCSIFIWKKYDYMKNNNNNYIIKYATKVGTIHHNECYWFIIQWISKCSEDVWIVNRVFMILDEVRIHIIT